jgi:hypothetical protein
MSLDTTLYILFFYSSSIIYSTFFCFMSCSTLFPNMGSYDFLISTDWLEKRHVILDYYNKTITSLDEEGNESKVQGIPRVVVIRQISAM